MDHPLTKDKYKDLRKRVVEFIKSAYLAPRQSNIVFVCGGNDANDMRRRFQIHFDTLLPGFEFFEPEFAMRNYFTSFDVVPFDIADFEEMIANLSHSIVMFPEAPGSFAETGYFSAIDNIAQKTLLVIDAPRQKNDSFISLGPARKIGTRSIFQPNLNIDYQSPDFSMISNRILQRSPLHKTLKSIEFGKFKNLSVFDLMCLIYQIVSILNIATMADIEFFLRAIFRSHISQSDVKKIVSVLVGSQSVRRLEPFGHFVLVDADKRFWQLRDGWKTGEAEIRLAIAAIYPESDPDFVAVMRSAGYAR